MTRTENNELKNTTELSQEAEIGTTVIRKKLSNTTLPIQRNYSSNTHSARQRNLAQRKPQMERSGRNVVQRKPQMEKSGRNVVQRKPQMEQSGRNFDLSN